MGGMLAGFGRRLLWLLAWALVAAGLYVSLGRQLVPLVAEYRGEIRERLEQALQQPVALGAVEGGWRAFAPQIVARDLRIGEGPGAVRIDSVTLVPDVFESLWQRTPQLASAELEGAHLELEQLPDGRWRLPGFVAHDEQAAPDPERILAGLRRLGELRVRDSQVTFEAHARAPLTLTYADFDLTSAGDRLRLDGRVILPDGQPLALQLRGQATPSRWRDAELDGYLSLPQSQWAEWLPERFGDWRLDSLQAGGELWLRWREQALQAATLRLHAPLLAGAREAQPGVSLRDLALTAYARRSEEGYRLLLDGLAFSDGQTRWGETRVAIEQVRESEQLQPRWLLQADRLELAPLVPLAAALLPLSDGAREALAQMQPHGRLGNVRLEYRPNADPNGRLRYEANVARAGISGWRGIPTVDNVDGSLAGDLGGGEARLSSTDFLFQLDQLFPQAWRYRQAQGRLRWTHSSDETTLSIPYMRLDGEEGRLAGDMFIRLLRDPEAEDYMDLRVGLSQGDARFAERYLPTLSPAMSPALVDWLREAIRGGTIEQGYFEYQGALQGADPGSRSLSLYFRVSDAELAFQPGWPALRRARGEVLIEDDGVRVRLDRGRLLDTRILEANAEIPLTHDGRTPRLRLNGRLEGTAGDALQILQQAPIGTAEVFDGWSASGPLSGTLDLDLPLGKGTPQVVARFETEGAQLKLTTPALQLDEIAGAFQYDTARGLAAESLRAVAFGQPVRGRIVATGKAGAPASRVEAQGQIEVERLTRWLGFDRPQPMSGTLPYQLQLELAGAASELRVHSSLLGATVDLPAPFGKPASERRDSSFRMTLQGPERHYELTQAALASLAYAAPEQRPLQGRGELSLGGAAAVLPDGDGVRVRGRVAQLDWAAWRETLARYLPAAGDGNAGAAEAPLLRAGRLQIDRFDGFGQTIENLDVQLTREGAAWRVGLDSERVGGTLRLADRPDQPIVVALRHLRLPEADPAAPPRTADPLAGVDPAGLPALDIGVERLLQGDALLGGGSLKLRPVGGGVEFRDLAFQLRGLQLGGSGGWSGGQSWYRGRLQGGNLAEVLAAWGLEPSVTSRAFQLDVDARWPGSPAWFGLERLSGTLSPQLREGQLVEMEGGAQALRVFGLLNLNSIGRRLRLDFSDLLDRGLSYDRVRGRLDVAEGVYRTREPLTLTGPSSNLELNGTLDMRSDRIDARLLVTLPVSNNLPLAAIIAGAPAIGGALFIADKLLGDRVARFASVQYRVEGPWQAPSITFDRPFEKPAE
nr:YhdP family protein [Stutzerimonas azotifigens]